MQQLLDKINALEAKNQQLQKAATAPKPAPVTPPAPAPVQTGQMGGVTPQEFGQAYAFLKAESMFYLDTMSNDEIVNIAKQKGWDPTRRYYSAHKEAYAKPGPGVPTIQGMPAAAQPRPNLPMNPASVEERRKQQGFTTEAFRGGEYTKNTRVYLTASQKLAKLYNKKVNQYWLNTNDYYVFNAKGKSWADVQQKAQSEAVKAGKKGIIVHNVGDEPDLSSQQLGPQTTYMVLDLSTVRAPGAAFDPTKSNMRDLLASGAAIGVGGASAAALSGDKAEAAPLPKVWHISPNDFERFGPLGERFGTGEVPVAQPGAGAQRTAVPGYYFAENTGTRDYYQRVVQNAYGKAYSYQNTLKATSDELVDLNKPFDAQPPRIQEVLKAHGITDPMQLNNASLETVQALDQAGVKGVQYLDKYSRAKGAGSRNYVVFDPDTIDIIKKTGLAALLLGGGAVLPGGRAQAQPASIEQLMEGINQREGAANGPKPAANMEELMSRIKPRAEDMTVRDVQPNFFQRYLGLRDFTKEAYESETARRVREGKEQIKANLGAPPTGSLLKGAREFLGIVSGAFEAATAPVAALGTMAGREAARRETERVEAVMRPEAREELREINKAAEIQDAQDTGDAIAALLPMGGIVPYKSALKAATKVPLLAWKGAGNLFAKPPTPLMQFKDKVADDLFRLRQTSVADKSEISTYLQQAPKEARTAQVQEIIYHLIEDKDWTKLSPEQQAFMSTPEGFQAVKTAALHLDPLRKEASNLFVGLRKIPNVAVDELADPTYIHRRAVGHTPILDPSAAQANPIVGYVGQQKGLPTDTTALQNRRFMGAQARDGSRLVVAEGPSGWEVHEKAAGTPAIHATKPIDEEHFEYQGKVYTVGQATTKEIEAATPATYYKNALANTADSLVRLRAVARHVEWLGQLTKTPEWAMFASTNSKWAKARSWRAVELPALQHWYMEPKLAAAFEDFIGGSKGPEWLKGLRKFNQMATASIFFTPTPHIENVMGHWLVGRGWDWIKPLGYRSMFMDGARAIRGVSTQNGDYRRLLKAGSGMIYGGIRHADFYREIARMAGMQITREPQRWDLIGRTLGLKLSPVEWTRMVYEGSKRMLWWANDVLMMQRVLELERKGLTVSEAIKDAEKHIPNYRIPTQVFGSRMFSTLLQDPAVTVFSRYHYGAINSYAHMLRDMLGPNATRQQRVEALGNAMMLGLLVWGLYPALDYGLQKLYGEPEAKKLRRGPAARIQDTLDVFGGEKSVWNIVANNLTMPAGARLAATAISGGHDPFTGQPISQPGMGAAEQAGQAASYALGQVAAPYQMFTRRPEEEGGRSVGRRLFGQYVTGEKDTSPGAEAGRFKAEKSIRRQAKRRAMRPRGPIESFIHGLTE